MDSSSLSEKEREQICVNALSGIIGIAKHLEDDSVSGLHEFCRLVAQLVTNPTALCARPLTDLRTSFLHVDSASQISVRKLGSYFDSTISTIGSVKLSWRLYGCYQLVCQPQH